jgi:hypothetical protein
MENRTKELLKDPAIIRIVKVIDRASLSILELLESGIAHKEINHALATGIVVFDRVKAAENYGVAAGDYYFDFLNSKVKLSDLGLSLLQNI